LILQTAFVTQMKNSIYVDLYFLENDSKRLWFWKTILLYKEQMNLKDRKI